MIELPDGSVLEGKGGVRRFAAKHAETDGRKQAVTQEHVPTATNSLMNLDGRGRFCVAEGEYRGRGLFETHGEGRGN